MAQPKEKSHILCCNISHNTKDVISTNSLFKETFSFSVALLILVLTHHRVISTLHCWNFRRTMIHHIQWLRYSTPPSKFMLFGNWLVFRNAEYPLLTYLQCCKSDTEKLKLFAKCI